MILKTDKNKESILCPLCDGEGKTPEGELCIECKGSGCLPVIKTK